MNTKQINYTSYLQINKLLDAQAPESQFHDEMLFIIIHQVYELWFKQVLFEIDAVSHDLSMEKLSDTDIFKVVSRLQRIIKIQQLMVDQVKILETMTPMDFLEFREMLGTASGFESYQFRLLEVKLGIKHQMSSRFISGLSESHQELIADALAQPSLLERIEQWLSRTPFLYIDDFNFWADYQCEIKSRSEQEFKHIEANISLSLEEKNKSLEQWRQVENHFNVLFDETLYAEQLKKGEKKMNQRSLHAALLIYIYRDQPAFHLPYMLLSSLVEIDDLLSSWRYAHILMVQRMIGQRVGTGGSTGQQYLIHAMQSRKVFTDLTNLASFLIRGSHLPLPEHVKQKLGLFPA